MKCQSPCLTIGAILGLPGNAWRPEDAVRLIKALVRPVLIAVVIVALGAALLFGGRALAPFVVGGGIGSPAHMATMSTERTRAERELQAEAALLLERIEASSTAAPMPAGELP